MHRSQELTGQVLKHMFDILARSKVGLGGGGCSGLATAH